MWLRPLVDITRLSKVVLGQGITVAPTGTTNREVVSLPVSFENIPKQCTFRVAEGRLTGPFGRTISAVTVDPDRSDPVARVDVRVKATVDAGLSGTFLGLVDACGPTGVPAVQARPVVLVVRLSAMTAERATNEVESLLDRAVRAVNDGDMQTARRLADEVLAGDARNAEAADLLASDRFGPGQLRRLTIMFCDLVDSTPLSGRLEPETYRWAIGQFKRVCRDAVDRHGGHVARVTGDGLLVFFGHPAAHEDDARRAVRAGLDITCLGRAPVQAGGPRDRRVAVGACRGAPGPALPRRRRRRHLRPGGQRHRSTPATRGPWHSGDLPRRSSGWSATMSRPSPNGPRRSRGSTSPRVVAGRRGDRATRGAPPYTSASGAPTSWHGSTGCGRSGPPPCSSGRERDRQVAPGGGDGPSVMADGAERVELAGSPSGGGAGSPRSARWPSGRPACLEG